MHVGVAISFGHWVVVSGFRGCIDFDPADDVCQDCKMLESVVDDVSGGVLSEGALRTRFPHFGAVFFAGIFNDRALLCRS